MDEKQLIEKIQVLRDIKPNKDWAILAKNRILEQNFSSYEKKISFVRVRKIMDIWNDMNFIFNHKYAFASLIVFFAIIGTFGFALKSTPGDALFALRKALEESQGVFVSDLEKQKFDLEQANRRLEDLVKIAMNKDSRKLAPAIDEYKATVSEVTKNLASQEDSEKIKELVAEVRKLENKEEEIKSLGVELGENVDKDIALVSLITREISKLEIQSLSIKQQALLAGVREDCERGNFVSALENILLINNSDEEESLENNADASNNSEANNIDADNAENKAEE